MRTAGRLLIGIGAACLQLQCAQLTGLDKEFELASEGSTAQGDGDGPTASPILPRGRLVFHRYDDYNNWDAEMYVAELPDGSLHPEIGEHFGICSPISGDLSPDGNSLLVVALPKTGDACGSGDRGQSEIYLLDLTELSASQGTALRLTENDVPDEDPRFSVPAATTVYFKHAGNLAAMSINDGPFRSCDDKPATSECLGRREGQQSNPAVTRDKLFYYEGDQNIASTNLYCFDLREGAVTIDTDLTSIRTTVGGSEELSFSRPHVFDGYVYYSRWESNANTVNRIYRKPVDEPEAAHEEAAFGTDTGSEYTDAAGLEGSLLVFSTTEAQRESGFDLFVADFNSAETWNIDELTSSDDVINSEKNEHWADFAPSSD